MLRPSMSQILKPGESYYEFVVAVAQKAREIADQAIKDKICLEDKSVTLAVQMFASGEQKLSDLKPPPPGGRPPGGDGGGRRPGRPGGGRAGVTRNTLRKGTDAPRGHLFFRAYAGAP